MSGGFFSFETEELDRFLNWIATEAGASEAMRHQLLDEILRASALRAGLVRMSVETIRDGAASRCVLRLRPTREFIEHVDRKLERLKANDKTPQGQGQTAE